MSSIRRTMRRAQSRADSKPEPLRYWRERNWPGIDRISVSGNPFIGVVPGYSEQGVVVYYDETHTLLPMQAAALRDSVAFYEAHRPAKVTTIGGSFTGEPVKAKTIEEMQALLGVP